MIARLRRDHSSTIQTLGVLKLGPRQWHTLERPWVPARNAPCGRKGVSCVPRGLYRLEPHNTEAHRNVWALVAPDLWVYHWDSDVPANQIGRARTTVLIHIANYVTELRGCIALGKTRAYIVNTQNEWMLQSSKIAISEFRGAGAADQLEII